MKIAGTVISGVAWTALLIVLYRAPIGAQGADWRLPLFLVISWILGLVLISWYAFGRQSGPGRMILTTVDENTGLANRRAFQGFVEPLLKAAVRFSENGLVVILNVNNLDRIIEQEGDEEAELVVIHVARAFLDSLRGSDILARYDKDELVAFLPKATTEFTGRVTDRIMMNVETQRKLMDKPRDLAVSVGYAEFDPIAPQSLDYLIRQAYKDMIRSMGERSAETEASSAEAAPFAGAADDEPGEKSDAGT